MSDLVSEQCVPCKGDVPPLKGADLEALHHELGSSWTVVDEHHLEKEFRFKDFVEALAFANRVGEMAEQQQHHPDILIAWGRAKLTIWTHKIGGLTRSDFVWAAKAEALYESATRAWGGAESTSSTD